MSGEPITITVNGAPRRVATGLTLPRLLEELGLTGPGTAVAVNEEVVRRDDYGRVTLRPGDRVEVIQAVGGG